MGGPPDVWAPSTAAPVVLACGAVAGGLAVFVRSRRRGGAGRALAGVLAALCLWNVLYAGELLAPTPSWRLALGGAKYVGIGALVPAWLAFILCWTGRADQVTRRRLLLLAVEPVAVLVLLAVPATRPLVRHLPAGTAHPLTAEVAVGPLFWVDVAYTDLLLLPATAVLVGSLLRRSRAYWLQAGALAGAALLPWIANLLFALSIGPFGAVDLTPVLFTVTGSVLAWGLFQQRLQRLAPLARSALVDHLTDAVVVLDAYGRVSDANPAARALLGGRLLGAPGAQVLPEVLDAPTAVRQVELRRDDRTRTYDVTDLALPGVRDAAAGRLLVLRDVTDRSRLEARLRELLADRARVAEQLSSSLRPAALPAVPGLQLAARFRPAGAGREIGGDFYDVVAVGDEWAFALGDVSGKGARAAATTAHARYTLRTLVRAGARPAQALEQLHRQLVDDLADETYLTVACGRLRSRPDGVSVVLALGGHPQPLVVRVGGEVEPVGRPGSAIGLFEQVEVHEVTVELGPGDALFLFTDGVSEARPAAHPADVGPGAMYGERGLATTLAGNAGRPARELADAVLDGVLALAGGQSADDIALLVLQAGRVSAPVPRASSEPQAQSQSQAQAV